MRILFLLLLIEGLKGEQHVLLDTTKETQLDWHKYPTGPRSPTPGWVEESFTNFEKHINWRSYVVCDVGYPNVNNWLRTPFIPREDANRIYIDIKFSLRNCDLFPGTALQCKETFSLYKYEDSEAEGGVDPPRLWDSANGEYKLIDRIAADEGRFTNNNEVIINTEKRSIAVSKKGVYFAFRDQGACLSLLAVKVYYHTCPEIRVRFAYFRETAAGKEVTSIERVIGTCVDNAVLSSEPQYLCQADGSWDFNSGGCRCMAGYEADENAQTCEPCPIGKFKAQEGNNRCQICPPYSRALYTGSVECACNPGYYRSREDPKGVGCTRPPSAPRNLTYKSLSPTRIVLSWNPPLDDTRSDTSYKVTCDKCSSRVAFQREKFPETEIIVAGLEPEESYTFTVTSVNGVSKFARRSSKSGRVITVRTDAAKNEGASSILLNVDEVHSKKIVLSWLPENQEAFEIKYFPKGLEGNSSNTIVTRKTRIEINGLRAASEYGFRIRAKKTSWGPFSDPPIWRATLEDFENPIFVGGSDEERNSPAAAVVVETTVLIGTISAVIVTLIVVGFLLFLIRKTSSHWRDKTEKDCDSLDYRGIDSHFNESHPIVVQTLSSPIYNPYKTYVDPHTYEDPHFAVRQFAKEIDSSYITIEAIIGGGEFGDVCRGRLSLPDRNDMLVAIKTLKPGSSERCRSDFLTEASIMGQFEHPNVIFLQGVVTKTNPIMIITEYMENGSLDTFLRANDGKFQVMQLIGMMRGIAYGMQYLAEMNYVHRDLAARNVLVNSQLVCKIADFGLSRQIADGNLEGAYTTRGGKIPVRWTAPEAIAFRKFTSASDVWSFGIVMWEIMSYGERPYWTWSNQDVIKAIEKGYRLPAPMDCPEANHQLMLDCWQKERSHRPTFASIVKTLDKLICCPETLRKLAKSTDIYGATTDSAPDFSAFRSVDEWLTSIKMSRYSENFKRAGITDISEVAKISLLQLQQNLNITLAGHQKKIFSSIQAMRAQSSMSEGFLV